MDDKSLPVRDDGIFEIDGTYRAYYCEVWR